MEPITLLYISAALAGLVLVLVLYRRVVQTRLRRFLVWWLINRKPGLLRDLLRQRRLSLWYKTSQSEGEQRIWGYADRHSITPGDTFGLKLSTGPGVGALAGHVEIFRIGAHGDSDRALMWRSDRIEVAERGFTNTAAAVGPAWPRSVSVEDTGGWRSGYHSVDFVAADGARERDVAFIVATSPRRDVDVLVKLATATYQAYNRWGGHGVYEYETPSTWSGRPLGPFEGDIPVNRGDMVAFDRPTASEFWEWEYHFVRWLERLAEEEGFSVAYATNFDLTRDASFASDCKLLISVGHDEYWSKEEFDQAQDRIFRQGGNVLFLGSNTAYWQVRYVDVNARDGNAGRQMVCFKSMDDPIGERVGEDADLWVTARFREEARRPETMLMGVAYQSNFAFRRQETPRYAYRVVSTDLPFFEGTGYRPGDVVAEIIGHEWDNRDPEADYECPGEARVAADERLWRQGRSRIDRLPPAAIKTVFSGDVVDIQGRPGKAEAVYFESQAGARVFSSGTNRWTWGLNREGYVQEPFRRFNRNLLLHFLNN